LRWVPYKPEQPKTAEEEAKEKAENRKQSMKMMREFEDNVRKKMRVSPKETINEVANEVKAVARSVSVGARAKSPAGSNDATRASTSEMHTRWMALANQMKEAPKAIQNLKRAKSVEQRKTAEEHIKEVFDLVKREQVEAESAAKKAKRDLALIARKAADEEVRQKFLREKAALEEASKNAMSMVKAVSSELAVAVKDASKREQAPSRSKEEPEPSSSQVLALEDDGSKRRPTR